MTSLYLLRGLTFAALALYTLFILVYIQRLLAEKSHTFLLLAITALADTLVFSACIWWELPIFIPYILMAVLLYIELSMLFHSKQIPRLLLSGMFPFLLLCVHGVMIPLFAVLRNNQMNSLILDKHLYTLSLLISSVICSVLLELFRRAASDGRLRMLFSCPNQESLACTSLYLLFAYLLLESYVYYHDFPGLWTSVFHMITSLVALASFFLVLWYAIDISAYIEYELKTRQMEKQLQRQVVHYQQYTKYVNDLRAFKHDYRRMVNTALHLVDTGAQEKAIKLLGQMNEEMESSLKYIQYSNHVVVDAILQECSSRCYENGIEFSAVANLPERIGLGDLELCRIFSNLVDNAYEACENMREGRRFITVDSLISTEWVTVEIRNSFAGQIELVDGQPVSHKADCTQHGVGLVSVRRLVESTGGFMQLEIDQTGIFVVKLHLCTACP